MLIVTVTRLWLWTCVWPTKIVHSSLMIGRNNAFTYHIECNGLISACTSDALRNLDLPCHCHCHVIPPSTLCVVCDGWQCAVRFELVSVSVTVVWCVADYRSWLASPCYDANPANPWASAVSHWRPVITWVSILSHGIVITFSEYRSFRYSRSSLSVPANQPCTACERMSEADRKRSGAGRESSESGAVSRHYRKRLSMRPRSRAKSAVLSPLTHKISLI